MTNDFSTSPESNSRTSLCPMLSSDTTTSEASRENPPAKTESLLNTFRSRSQSSSWLQSRVPLIVRCLSAAVRPPPVSSSREPSSLSDICSKDRVPTLAAASSMASGIPSSLLHTSATACALPAVKAKEGSRLRARARNRRADSDLSSSSTMNEYRGSGALSGGTGHLSSPSTPSSSRLVANTRKRGHESSRTSTSRAVASNRCSQLSTTRSNSLLPKTSVSVSTSGSSGRSGTSTASATALGTSASSESGANSTSHTPSGYASRRSRDTSRARRVLPEPPAPVSVSSLLISSSRLTSSISRSRPMKLLLGAGRLCREVLRSWCTLLSFKTATSVVWLLALKQARGLAPVWRQSNLLIRAAQPVAPLTDHAP